MPQAGSSTRTVHRRGGSARSTARRPRLALACLGQRCSAAALRIAPLGAQRLDHGGQHQPLDVGARRVVGAERVALGGVERALQQGAEDRGLDVAPVGARRRGSSSIWSRSSGSVVGLA